MSKQNPLLQYFGVQTKNTVNNECNDDVGDTDINLDKKPEEVNNNVEISLFIIVHLKIKRTILNKLFF